VYGSRLKVGTADEAGTTAPPHLCCCVGPGVLCRNASTAKRNESRDNLVDAKRNVSFLEPDEEKDNPLCIHRVRTQGQTPGKKKRPPRRAATKSATTTASAFSRFAETGRSAELLRRNESAWTFSRLGRSDFGS
jgi:hypothetical protein